VAERFYMQLVPQAREVVRHAADGGKRAEAAAAAAVIDRVLARPEHAWFEQGAEDQAARIRAEMERRYGQAGRTQ
jgi:hypothetical protein